MRWKISAALAAMLAIVCNARAADLQQLVQETQRISATNDEITMVWWMPRAFWDASLSQSGISPTETAQVLKVLDGFMVFALVHAKVGAAGLTDVSSMEDLLQNAKLEIGKQTVGPLAPESLSATATRLLAQLKPGLARNMGQVGQSMQIVVYPSMKNGRPLINQSAQGSFRYTLYGQTYFWHLPLASLLPPKFDRGTHEQFPGNFQFNPYTGARLGSGQ